MKFGIITTHLAKILLFRWMLRWRWLQLQICQQLSHKNGFSPLSEIFIDLSQPHHIWGNIPF